MEKINIKKLNETMRALNIEATEIGRELVKPDFNGIVYLTAEEFSRQERQKLGEFFVKLKDDTATADEIVEFLSFLDNALGRILQDENIIEKNLSDDGFCYAINSLDMPMKIKEFCEALNTAASLTVIQGLLTLKNLDASQKMVSELEQAQADAEER